MESYTVWPVVPGFLTQQDVFEIHLCFGMHQFFPFIFLFIHSSVGVELWGPVVTVSYFVGLLECCPEWPHHRLCPVRRGAETLVVAGQGG